MEFSRGLRLSQKEVLFERTTPLLKTLWCFKAPCEDKFKENKQLFLCVTQEILGLYESTLRSPE